MHRYARFVLISHYHDNLDEDPILVRIDHRFTYISSLFQFSGNDSPIRNVVPTLFSKSHQCLVKLDSSTGVVDTTKRTPNSSFVRVSGPLPGLPFGVLKYIWFAVKIAFGSDLKI